MMCEANKDFWGHLISSISSFPMFPLSLSSSFSTFLAPSHLSIPKADLPLPAPSSVFSPSLSWHLLHGDGLCCMGEESEIFKKINKWGGLAPPKII